MKILTHALDRLNSPLTKSQNLQTYCGLDCCITMEVLEELEKIPHPSPRIYDFERALQGPYLDMMRRGFKVDQLSRNQAAESLRRRMEALYLTLDEFARAVWDKPLNPRSPKQLQEFFYGKMQLPEMFASQKGVRRISTNREALEKLDEYIFARPFVQIILRIRDLAKQLDFFTIGIDADGRFRAGYNIAGTETGRPSSSENAFGTGGNGQNIAPSLRYVMESDPGFVLCVVDLEQVEARDVGYLCGCLFDDWRYLDFCEAGDLHTENAKLVWPELGWTGNREEDRKIAERPFYRDFSHRDMTKRGGHLTNYYGSAWTMGRSLKIPIGIARDFQDRYCKGPSPAHPVIPRYWQWVAQQLQTVGTLTTPFGRTRQFFSRPGDDATLREGIAFLPQGTTADRMNLGLWRVWKKVPEVQLLAQTYDSITFQFGEHLPRDRVIGDVLDVIRVELKAPGGRSYVVPGEAKVGWNWGNEVTQGQVDEALRAGKRPPRLNPLGLRKWKPGGKDDRKRVSGLDRLVGG